MEAMKSMKRTFGRTPRAKAKRQASRSLEKAGKMVKGGEMRQGIRKLKAKRQMKRIQRETPWRNLLVLVGGAATLAAFMAIGRSRANSQQKKTLAQSGQTPGRSHIQMSSHPAAQSRYQPSGRQFGGSPQQR